MIIKPLTSPFELLQIEALNERLPSYHKEKGNVEQQAKILCAGYNGENALQYNLSFLFHEQYLIFHQLRLNDVQGAFQMDILLVSARRLCDIVKEYINNREARVFLQVESRHIVKQLLQKENLESFGNRGGRRYKLYIKKLLLECV